MDADVAGVTLCRYLISVGTGTFSKMERAVTAESKNPPIESEDVWTVRRILEWTVAHLKKHGSDTPRLDTEILLAHARGCRRIDLYVQYDKPLTETERMTMRALVQRRAKAEPVAYLVGHREFFGLDFRVTSDVFIPRPDTETLVMELLEQAKQFAAPRVLDVCTGSGCIAISAAVNLPAAQVTAIDFSLGALQIARENAAQHEVDSRVEFLRGDLLSDLPPDVQFDVIASNPPYIPENEIEHLQADVRLHEPRLALDGGPQGLVIVRRLIVDVLPHLTAGGWLMMELSSEQAEPVCDLLRSDGHYTEIKILNDLSGRARVVRAQRLSPG